MINITKYSSKNMDVNTYILAKENQAIVIDPGFNGEDLLKHISNFNLKINMVILTHGHFDHIRDLKLLLENQKFIVVIHEEDFSFLYDPNLNLSSIFQQDFILDKSVEVRKVKDKETIDCLKEKFKIIHLPGHTKGSMGIIYNQHFFSGDTLFYDSIGRVDLPTGNNGKMHQSLKKILTSISKHSVVYPGHGRGGQMSDIIAHNPYLTNLR